MTFEDDIPTVTILLLGDSGVGKSTFLSYAFEVIFPWPSAFAHQDSSRLTLGAHTQDPSSDDLPSYSLPTLRDLDQPFLFNVTLFGRPYRFQFYDTASPENYTLLHPDFIIMCYSIDSKPSLYSLTKQWKYMVETHFNYDESLPVMVLGLKRDLRRDDGTCVMPQQGLGIAQEMRVDKYAECSALTGELCRQVLEDVTRTAARTTTEAGAKSADGCRVM
jgi:Ras homolog gene family, member A